MNQRRGSEDEASSRSVNAQPWEPMPGMEKRRCPERRYCDRHWALPRLCAAAAWPPRMIGPSNLGLGLEAPMPETSRYGLAAMRDPA
jgi:hypothetical protein